MIILPQMRQSLDYPNANVVTLMIMGYLTIANHNQVRTTRTLHWMFFNTKMSLCDPIF